MIFPSSAYGILECTAVCTSFLSCTNQRKSINLAPAAPDPRTKPNWIGFPGTRARFSEAECLNAVPITPIGSYWLIAIWDGSSVSELWTHRWTDCFLVFHCTKPFLVAPTTTEFVTTMRLLDRYNTCVQFLVASLLGLSHPNKIGSIKDVTACSLNFDAECFASFGSPSV